MMRKNHSMAVRLVRGGVHSHGELLIHSVFRRKESLCAELISPAGPHITRITPHIPKETALASVGDPYAKGFHPSILEARKVVGNFKMVDDDYSVVESFLRKSFRKKQSLSASEIAETLGMEYGDLREVLAVMIKEGKLGVK